MDFVRLMDFEIGNLFEKRVLSVATRTHSASGSELVTW